MEQPIKIYAGRSSVCAGDDVFAPNPFTFDLPEDLSAFIELVNQILPFGEWSCYRGQYSTGICDAEDGILVYGKADRDELISLKYDRQRNKAVVKCADRWKELICAHPYVFFE